MQPTHALKRVYCWRCECARGLGMEATHKELMEEAVHELIEKHRLRRTPRVDVTNELHDICRAATG